MWDPNIKAINITKLVQMIFNAWFGYFEYVKISPMWYNIDCSQLMSWFDFNNWCTQPWSIVQREVYSMKLCKPLLTYSISHSTFSIHYTNLFLRFSCIFTFLEVIKHKMPKMLLFSSIFNIKIATQKFTSFNVFFLNAHWYDSCHIQSNKIVSNEVKDN